MSNDLLLAIPFSLLWRGAGNAAAWRKISSIHSQLFGPVRGGLSYAVIFVGAILAPSPERFAALRYAMGVISMTPMLKYGYSTRHTMGVIAASGTITQLIPPSLVLVRAGRSNGPVGRRHVRRRHWSKHHSKSRCSAAGFFIVSVIGRKMCRHFRRRRARCRAGRSGSGCHARHDSSLGLIFLVLEQSLWASPPQPRPGRWARRRHVLAWVLRHAQLAPALSGHGVKRCALPPWWFSF